MKETKHFTGHRWNDKEIKLLMELWQKDKTTSQIAKALNCSEYAILKQARRLRDLGIPLKKRKAGNKPDNASEKWTKGEIEYLIRRRNEKATNEEIGNELQRSWDAIQAMIYKLRNAGVSIAMRGNGVSRKYDIEAAKAMALHLNNRGAI